MKTRTLIGIISALLTVSVRAADFAVTFHFSPNLDREANPLVYVWGLGWTSLIVSNIAILALILVGIGFYALTTSKDVQYHQSDGIWAFASCAIFKKVIAPHRLILSFLIGWPLPRNWKQAGRLLGLAFSWGMIFASASVVFSWLALSGWKIGWYKLFYSNFHFSNILGLKNYPLTGVVIGLLGYFLAIIVFFITEFNENNKQALKTQEGLSSL
jgi:hypothetical protein